MNTAQQLPFVPLNKYKYSPSEILDYFYQLLMAGYITVYDTGIVRTPNNNYTKGSYNKSSGYQLSIVCPCTKRKRSITTARLVYLAFYGMFDANMIVTMKNGIKSDIRPCNLQLEVPNQDKRK